MTTRVTRELMKNLPPTAFRRVSSPVLTLVWAPLPTASRYTVVVPKKIAVMATARNRLKRLYREALRTAPPPLHTLIILHVRSNKHTTLAECKRELSVVLSRAFNSHN